MEHEADCRDVLIALSCRVCVEGGESCSEQKVSPSAEGTRAWESEGEMQWHLCAVCSSHLVASVASTPIILEAQTRTSGGSPQC